MTTEDPRTDPLDEVLASARDLGFLGPGPVGPHIEHARGFASMVTRTPESFLDLGSGGGVPGLVLALGWPETQGVLLEAMRRRADFLDAACERLGLDERVRVVCARAEDAARADLRGTFELVTARSFGRPSVTAECGAGFLRPGGLLVVSEPPEDDPARWPDDRLAGLGLMLVAAGSPSVRYAVLRRVGALPDRVPRRPGIPAKRPLWA